MNLAVHGLEGHIVEAITYYQDEHTLVAKGVLKINFPFSDKSPTDVREERIQ